MMRSDHLAETLKHLCHYWETREAALGNRSKAPTLAQPFSIALSREAGTRGTSIAQEVGKRLQWVVYDNELLERIALDMGLRATLLKSVDERRHSWLQETAETFMRARSTRDWATPVTDSEFVHQLIKTVLALGSNGECVIVGRGAAFILPPATTLRVRLVGSERDRAAELARKHSLPEREPLRRLRNIDRERNDFVQDHFLRDPTDPRNFDLILNGPRFSVAENAEVIVETLHRFERHVAAKELQMQPH
jgi:cytidylate kinase